MTSSRARHPKGALWVTCAVLWAVGISGCGSQVVSRPVGNPDPGGIILSTLKQIEAAVPAGATVTHETTSKSYWITCQANVRASGWSDEGESIYFQSDSPGSFVISQVSQVLDGKGWDSETASSGATGLPGTVGFVNQLAGYPTFGAALLYRTNGDGGGIWELTATSPPAQHPAGWCKA